MITSLAQYSESRQLDPEHIDVQQSTLSHASKQAKIREEVSSVLFLQIYAAADYYTTNLDLMENVPPVYVDIILDPFLFNIFPRSLVPTAIYITVLAIGSWFLSKHINAWFLSLSENDTSAKKKDL